MNVFVSKEFRIDFVRRREPGKPLKGFVGIIYVVYNISELLPDVYPSVPCWETMASCLVNKVLFHGEFKNAGISILNGALILDEADLLCATIDPTGLNVNLFKFNGEPTTSAIGNLIASLISEQSVFDENVIHPVEINFRVDDESIVVDL